MLDYQRRGDMAASDLVQARFLFRDNFRLAPGSCTFVVFDERFGIVNRISNPVAILERLAGCPPVRPAVGSGGEFF